MERQKISFMKVIETMNMLKSHYEKEATPRQPLRQIRYSFIVAIAAIEKQMPKKPIKQSTDEKIHYKCACCNTILQTRYKDGWKQGNIGIYCSKCGQRQESEG